MLRLFVLTKKEISLTPALLIRFQHFSQKSKLLDSLSHNVFTSSCDLEPLKYLAEAKERPGHDQSEQVLTGWVETAHTRMCLHVPANGVITSPSQARTGAAAVELKRFLATSQRELRSLNQFVSPVITVKLAFHYRSQENTQGGHERRNLSLFYWSNELFWSSTFSSVRE